MHLAVVETCKAVATRCRLRADTCDECDGNANEVFNHPTPATLRIAFETLAMLFDYVVCYTGSLT